jgi:hypothetical protein
LLLVRVSLEDFSTIGSLGGYVSVNALTLYSWHAVLGDVLNLLDQVEGHLELLLELSAILGVSPIIHAPFTEEVWLIGTLGSRLDLSAQEGLVRAL